MGVTGEGDGVAELYEAEDDARRRLRAAVLEDAFECGGV